jgi:hypothetical protein
MMPAASSVHAVLDRDGLKRMARRRTRAEGGVRQSHARHIRALRRERFRPDETRYRLGRERGNESIRGIRKHFIPYLGEFKFADITAALLRAFLKAKAEQGLGKGTVNHLRFYLTDICRSATAEGYLMNDVSEGQKAPKKLVKRSAPKEVATLEQYAEA